ncbi:uncharacterized protein LOC144102502 [Amblyomma americanum]
MKPGCLTIPSYRCKSCTFVGNNRKHLANHVALNHSSRVYRCSLCVFVTRYKSNFYRHRRNIHKLNSANVCEMCGQACDNQDELVAHASNEHPQFLDALLRKLEAKGVRCTRYAAKMNMEDGGTAHASAKKTVAKNLQPELVTGDVSGQIYLQNGVPEKQNENAEQSKKRPRESSPPVSNKKGRTGRLTYTCAECDFVTKWPREFLSHRRDVHGDRISIHECPFCEYASKQLQNLKKHCNTVHKEEMYGGIRTMTTMVNGTAHRMFKCRFCPLTNKRRANVKIHERMHTASKGAKFQCVLCSYRCNNTGVLARHMKLHKADNPSLDLSRMKTFCENLNALPSRPAVAKKSVPESAAAQRSEISALKDKLKTPSRKKIFSYFCDKCPAMFKSHTDLDTHKTYHNSAHLYPCHLCDYRARRKPHLHKHLLVHTPKYAERQNGLTLAEIRSQDRSQQPESATPPAAPAAADQMLLLEKAETRAFVDAGSQSMAVKLHYCHLCPGAFLNARTLKYHLSLHGTAAVYYCPFCTYAANSTANMSAHKRLHYLNVLKQKQPPKMFRCNKCPASFSRYNRFDSHLTLHGSNERFRCSQCDYSVKFAANLVKHRKLHEILVPESKQLKVEPPAPLTSTPHPPENGSGPTTAVPLSDSAPNAATPAVVEEKHVYICSKCPYAFHRRETVVNHLQRHGTSEGLCCTFCDYRSVHMSTLGDHTRRHFQPVCHYKPQAYMKCDSLEIWSTSSDGTRTVVFRDDGDEKYFPELDDCDDAGEDDTSSPASTPASSGSCSASTASCSPQLQLNNKDLEPAVLKLVKHRTDDVVLASKETLEELVSNVVMLNDKKDEMPPGCKTQVVNTAVLDGTKQLNEVGEVAQAEHKSESETDSTDDGESAQDLFNCILNPAPMECEDLEDEKDVYYETISEVPDVAYEVECETVEEDLIV